MKFVEITEKKFKVSKHVLHYLRFHKKTGLEITYFHIHFKAKNGRMEKFTNILGF